MQITYRHYYGNQHIIQDCLVNLINLFKNMHLSFDISRSI